MSRIADAILEALQKPGASIETLTQAVCDTLPEPEIPMGLLERIVAESLDLIGIRTLLDQHPGDPDHDMITSTLNEFECVGFESVANILGEIQGYRDHAASGARFDPWTEL